MEKEILGRAVEVRTAEGEGRWEVWAKLYDDGKRPADGDDGVEREFYGIGEDQEDAEEMVEVLIINYLKKKWKKERLRGQSE